MADRAALLAEVETLQGQLGSVDKAVSGRREMLLNDVYDLKMKQVSRDERKFLQQAEIESELGGEVVYGQEVPNFWLQKGISAREEIGRAVEYANNSEHKPEGAEAYGVMTDSGNRMVAYKYPNDRKFYAINDPGPSMGDWGAVAGEVLTAETVGGIVAELAMPWKKATVPAKMIYKMGKAAYRTTLAAAGAAGGRGVDEVAEGMSDDEYQSWTQISSKMIESGAWAAGGHLVLAEPFEVFRGALDKHGFSLKEIDRMSKQGATPEEMADLADAMNLKESEIQELLFAIGREELEPLGLGELGSPLAQRAQSQAVGVSASEARRSKRKVSSTARRLMEDRYGVEDINDLDDAALIQVVEKQEREAHQLMKRSFTEKGINFDEGATKEIAGKNAAETVLDYKQTSSLQAERYYDQVFDLAETLDVDFDLSQVKNAIDAELTRVTLIGKPKVKTDSYFDLNSPGKITETTVTQEDVAFKRQLEGPLEAVLLKIKEAADLQPSDKLAALRQIRSNLREMSEPDPRMITSTPSQRSATRIAAALNDSMHDAAKKSGDDAFLNASLKADAFWKERQGNLEAFGYMKDMNSLGAGERIYRRVASADITNAEASFLMKHMTQARKDEFRSALYVDMRRHPEKINSTLNSLDRAGEHLIPEPARKVLHEYRRIIERGNKSAAKRMLEGQAEAGERVSVLIQSGDGAAMKSMVESGALSTEDMSRGVVRDFILNTVDLEDGLPVLNRGKYESKIHAYKNKGVLDLVDPRAREMLENIRLYNSFLRKGGDVGDSLASAALASSVLKGVQDPIGAAKAGFRIYQLSVLSRLAHSPAALQVLKGNAANLSNYPKTRGLMLATVLVAKDIFKDHEE